MGTFEIPYKNVQNLTKTVELPYFCKDKYGRYCKILNEMEVVIYTTQSIGYWKSNVLNYDELIEISESEFEAFANETEKFILAKLNKTI